MKSYTLDTEFTFGKFEGKTVKLVVDIEPDYIVWCAINLDHFYISDDVLEEIKNVSPSFNFSEEGVKRLNKKYEAWKNKPKRSYTPRNYTRPSYGHYAGSYAQDVAGYSDDIIDDVFEGDPEAYWNID